MVLIIKNLLLTCKKPVPSRRSTQIYFHLVNTRTLSNFENRSVWQINRYGKIEELKLSASSEGAAIKSPNELLIKVHASSINPIDIKMLGGYGKSLINILRKQKGMMRSGSEFPLVLGRDFSGTVVEAGRNITKYKIGDEVWGAIGAERPGTHAKFTVVSQDEISLKPRNVSHIEAASIPYVAATTWAALCTVGELKERKAVGRRILILGGSGGIGTFSVQLAKAWGMHVTTTCSTNAVEMVRDLGADMVVDYKTKDIWQELKRYEKYDYILDTVGADAVDKGVGFLSPWQNSHLITLITPFLKNSDNLGVIPGMMKTAFTAGLDTLKGLKSGGSVRWAVFIPSASAMEKVKLMVEAGQIKPTVQEVFPFSKVPDGYKRVAGGHLRGKIVIDNLSD
ncbi:reticulon-4-interacting protein 1 homolog, mitochondrial-like [Physella acuta]|uniref:reticulon-4-interacting protein 1 homolog, mitochondrial-like n=1 Tax=Physella acuta TaxID=109671 RepID=UPI0027DE92BB|nr:reticulon-4-interacting protein 1 homolog, mitochondrial-like [Physella acuta]XP_059166377.1 reticulon-4-interacting protein 1 homolog, mitochondrial-like [Physella acuta]XP_059166378.1 reticulon-4-interacting protein 1 homolog, mitochondrial-like [Physella acuta]XP_059166379.1 reticulon-4-interacting protein 1 homolog, mitochondrial-like [Physella acuta]